MEVATTDDPDRLRAVVADLLGHMVYLEAKEEAKEEAKTCRPGFSCEASQGRIKPD